VSSPYCSKEISSCAGVGTGEGTSNGSTLENPGQLEGAKLGGLSSVIGVDTNGTTDSHSGVAAAVSASMSLVSSDRGVVVTNVCC